jgi:hypothetical protein
MRKLQSFKEAPHSLRRLRILPRQKSPGPDKEGGKEAKES